MLDLGYVLPGKTLNIPFATYDSNDPSASVTTTGLAATDIEIYKDGSLTQRALTQRASDTGYAVDIDFDALTGLHTIQVDLSSNATAGFFAAGSEYLVAVSSITVDAATVSLWAARFTIGIPGMIHGSNIAAYTSTDNFTLTTGSTNDDAYNGCILIAYDVATEYQVQVGVIEDYTGSTKTVNLKADPGVFTMTANDNIIIMPPALLPVIPGAMLDVTTSGAAGIDWGNVENPTTAVDLSATDIQLCDTITTYTGNTVQTGDSFARIGAAGAGLTGITGAQLAADQAVNATKLGGAAVTATTSVTIPAASTLATTTGAVGSVTGAVGSVTGAVGSVTTGVTLANGAITDASLAGNMETVFETDFATNYNATRNAWATNVQDTVGTGNLPADVIAISTSTAAADNLETLFDGNEGFYSAYAGPRGPGVYLNDLAANTSTTNGVDGTIGNPVSTIAAAKTLADSMSLDRIYIFNDTAVTLAATMEDYEFVGLGEPGVNSVALASQDVDQSSFFNLTITGVQGGSQRARYEDCVFGTATIYAYALRCGFTDAVTGVTFSNNNDVILDSCFSMVAGNATPIFICSGANLDVSFRHYSGGIEIKSSHATATVSIESMGQVIFNADCSTSTVVTMRGLQTVTDNTGGMAALTEGARIDVTQIKDQVVAGLDTDTYAEPAKGAPGATISLSDKIGFLYKAWRNKSTQTATTYSLYNDDTTTVDHDATVSDDATTATRGEMTDGP
jgi:hypothetical protein